MNPLRVPYFSQRDSSTDQGPRMCFSSSCAMLVEALKPGTLPGPNGDDTYLGRVFRYGDTTDAASQLKALAFYGVKANFVQNADWSKIEGQIGRGIPVPIGILHHGRVSAPTGGGHWLIVVGHTPTHVVVHDPFGDLDLVNGGYLSSNGKALRYSRKNLGPRWMVEGPGTGWAILATG
jgi:hypothetical protein